MEYKLPQLGFAYNALEPVMDEKTVMVHYSKHHQTYLNNLNLALKDWIGNIELEQLLKQVDTLPQDIKLSVKNNGGGVYNHNLFWSILTPEKNMQPQGQLLQAINNTFGSFENFKTEFENAGKKQFGSGWVWLIKTNLSELKIVTTSNQDTPLLLGTPILAFDVWEHAYYLKYQNLRADYLHNLWQIVNWNAVQKYYLEK